MLLPPIAFALLAFAVCFAKGQDVQVKGKIVCYFSAWANYRAEPMNYDIEDVPGDKCTHIIYSFVGLDDATWTLKSIDQEYDIEKRKLIMFLKLCQS